MGHPVLFVLMLTKPIEQPDGSPVRTFQTLDRNEDGNLNYDEFKKLFEARAAMINGNAESQVREIGNASSPTLELCANHLVQLKPILPH